MFFYPPVLKRHTGCFSTIWLVATKGIRVPRRDFLKVNVQNTCDGIIDYVLEKVPPPRPGLPRPRFSLYLSSQLQYGVVVVFHRQCAILLEELQSIVGQLVKQRTSQKIDMDEQSRPALDLHDALTLLEEAERAPDPLFGVMLMQDATLSPSALIKMSEDFHRETSPAEPEPTQPAAAAAAGIESLTATPDSITLRETEPVTLPEAEFEGEELFDEHPDTLDLLMAQQDHFPEEGDVGMQREEQTPGEEEEEEEEMEREREQEKERTKELTGATLELQPTTLSSEDALLPPQEEPGLPVEKPPATPTDQLTPTAEPVLPPPAPPTPPTPPTPPARERKRAAVEVGPPAEEETRRKRGRRKRQLVFFDPETQLSQAVLQAQIDNPHIETRRPLLPTPPSHRLPSAAELLDNPCTLLPEAVQFLWRQAATVTPLLGSDLQIGERGSESTDSDKEREGREVEGAEREEERVELSSKEVARHMAEPEMFDVSGHGSLPLEGSDQREGSREISPMYTPERERSPILRSVSTLQDIPEVLDEFLDTAPAESPGLQPELPEQGASSVLFASLLPPEVDRRTVSRVFHRLLENLSAGRLHVRQDEPYGDIMILPKA